MKFLIAPAVSVAARRQMLARLIKHRRNVESCLKRSRSRGWLPEFAILNAELKRTNERVLAWRAVQMTKVAIAEARETVKRDLT